MHRSALFVISLAFVTLVAGAASAAYLQQQDEPADDEARHKAATEAYGKRKWAEAARHFEKLVEVEKYKAEALYKLALCDWNRQQMKSAGERFEKFVAAFPKHDDAPNAQLMAAQSLARQQKKEEAVKAFKKLFRDYPNTNATMNGQWQYWNLVEKQFQFSVQQSYTEGEQPVINGYMSNVDKVQYRLYRLDTSEVVKKVEAGAKMTTVQEFIATVPASARKLIKEWDDEPRIAKRRYESVSVKPEISEAGLYLFEAEHDEIAVHVTVVVARYGIIVKAAENKSIVFAVDRRTGRAQPDMKVRVWRGDKPVEGTTDKDGLFVLDGGGQGAVIGIKDGELAFSNVWYRGIGEELKAYFFTDRPVYRPNQTVNWKAVFRKVKQGEFTNIANQACDVTIRDPRGNIVYQKKHETSANGTVHGELTLGDEPPLGMYYLQTSIGGYGQFRVEEYRKPEYEVTVAFDGRPYSQGDDVKARVDVKYYFGSPVVDSDVQYTIWRRPYYKPYWRGWGVCCDWYFDDDGDDDEEWGGRRGKGGRGYYYGYGEQVSQGVGKTDKEGQLRIAYKPAEVEYDAVYTVVANVVDRSRRQVTGSGSAKVTKAQIELSIAPSRTVFKPGERVLAKVRAVDTEGTPVKDLALTMTADVSDWWHRGDKSGWDHAEFWKGESRTDENGVASFEFVADKAGRIRLVALAQDRRGREVKDDQWLWVSDDRWSAGFQNFQGLDIVPDKTTYASGETAQVLLTSQHKNVHALFTVECDGVYRHQVVHVKGHSALVEVPIDGKKFAPNVYFTVTALVKNEYVFKQKSIAVPPAESLLNVKIAMDKKQYRPRETARVTIEVTDSAGKPVAAELAVGMVDESIYAIQEELAPDMRKFFFAKRWNRVATNTSMHFYDYGRAEGKFAADAARAPGAEPQGGRALKEESGESLRRGKAGGKQMAETETRSYFPDTMYWASTVVTGADGKFTYETSVPDSLTTWRTTVRGITADHKVGHQTHEVVARKEVIVRLTTPRFLTQNDECTISGVVHNYRADVDEVVVKLESEGVELVGDREVKLKVPTGEDRRVDWKVLVKKAGKATFTAKALTEHESDAMQLVLPILPHGSMQYVAKAGVAEGKATEKLTVPATAIAEATELRLSISPSVASQVLEALDYLAGYPYGCVEQTMSRFLPTVITGSSLRKLGLEKKELTKELPEMVNAGLQRLYNFQHQDGGWGWWEGDQSHPYMTAYVMYGLAKAREADFFVDPNAMSRGRACLEAMVKAGKTDDRRRRFEVAPIDTRAYIVFVLAESGAVMKEELDELFKSRAELSNYSMAVLAIALQKAKRDEEAKTVLANLDEKARSGAAHLWWDGHGQRWHWMSNTIETTAYALKAIVAADPKDERIHKIVRWLAANRHGNRWHSTKDTAAVVFALTDVMAATGELEADFGLVVKVDGKEVMRERITKANLLSFNGAKVLPLSAGDHEVTIEKDGKGTLYYAAYLKYFNMAEKFEPSKGSVRIERKYSKVTMEGKNRILEDLADGATVKSGDLVEVTLTVTADGAHEYMMIEDPLPSGFEVVKEDRFYGGWGWGRHWGWWYSRIEARDERVCIASTVFNGTQTVSYTMRAETPGDFRVLPTTAYNMYVPDIAGSSGGQRIRVTEK